MSSRPSPPMCMQDSSILPCYDYNPVILPLLVCGLDLPSLLSFWQLLIQMPSEWEGKMSCLQGA